MTVKNSTCLTDAALAVLRVSESVFDYRIRIWIHIESLWQADLLLFVNSDIANSN